ncbi:MAG: AtpZ/AtpI family protein [Candidatus Izemoplasmatales bacterium]|nr:AtpZ/AtpI family protein [Candidatus Izemoplasmatales bacterium]
MEQNKMKEKKEKSAYFLFNLIIQFFVETFVAMAIGYFIGNFVDEKFFPEQNIFVYVFIIIGIFAGLSNLIKRSLKISKGEEDEKDKSN